MPHYITEGCVACGDCSIVCSQAAIEDGYTFNLLGDIDPATRGGGNPAASQVLPGPRNLFWINGNCNDCGRCRPVCRTEAIIVH